MGGEPAVPSGEEPGGKYDGPTSYTPPSMLFPRRFGFRLCLLVLVAVLPLLALQVHATLQSRKDAIIAAGASAGRLARLTSRGLQEVNTRAVLLLEAVSREPVITKGTPAERTAFLAEQLSRSPGFADFHLVAADGTIVAGALDPGPPKGPPGRPAGGGGVPADAPPLRGVREGP